MIAKLPSNNVNNIKSDVDFDVEVHEYVYKNRFIRRGQLIKYMVESHQDRGYSKPNVEHKLQRLTKNGSLIIVKHPDLEKYGVYDTDKNASYLTLEEIIIDYSYLNELFSYFESDNSEYDKNSILNEIELHKETYSFTREKLDVLVDKLFTDDEELQFHILRILTEYINDRHITPTNKENLLKCVNQILDEFAGVSREHEIYRTGLIFILGYYNDDSVIKWLKHDVVNLKNNSDFDKIKTDYGNTSTARIVNKHKKELFYFANELKKEGKSEEARLVYNIKNEVAKILGYVKEREANFNENASS
jgi:hypothetical protein